MDKSATSIAIILGVITIAFAGVYFYTERNSTLVDPQINKQTVLNQTRDYISNTSALNRIKLDYSFFEDQRLLSLQSFSTPIADSPIGRPNPFADVPGREQISNF